MSAVQKGPETSLEEKEARIRKEDIGLRTSNQPLA